MQGANKKLLFTTMIPRCTFAGGDENVAFTGKQLRYPCKLRRHICARCGMHRGEHHRANAGVREENLPPRKRSVFRRLGQFQLQGVVVASPGGARQEREDGGAGGGGDLGRRRDTKGKRGPRRKRADEL